MSLKAIHSIYSFSEAPERESWSTADTTLKTVKNIQFEDNFTLIFFFFLCESVHCFCSFPYLKTVLSMLPPRVTLAGMVIHPQRVAEGGQGGSIPHLSSWREHLIGRTAEGREAEKKLYLIEAAALSGQHTDYSPGGNCRSLKQ